MSDVRVRTSGKVALLSHCLLNQNSKPYMRARYPGAVTPVIEILLDKGYALFQLPCPEVSFTGLNRWSAVIEQYDTPKYRGHCREIAVQVVDQLAQYPLYGYTCLLIGIDGSPTCGVRLTGSSDRWRGFPGSLESARAFVECIRTGTRPSADAVEGAHLCRICEAARLSVDRGGDRVAIDDVGG